MSLRLADVITALRSELQEVRRRAGTEPVFTYDKVDVKLAVSAQQGRNAEVGVNNLFVAKIGAADQDTVTFEVSLSLHLLAPAGGAGRSVAGSGEDPAVPSAK